MPKAISHRLCFCYPWLLPSCWKFLHPWFLHSFPLFSSLISPCFQRIHHFLLFTVPTSIRLRLHKTLYYFCKTSSLTPCVNLIDSRNFFLNSIMTQDAKLFYVLIYLFFTFSLYSLSRSRMLIGSNYFRQNLLMSFQCHNQEDFKFKSLTVWFLF